MRPTTLTRCGGLATPKRLQLPTNLRNARRHEADTAASTGGKLTRGSGNQGEKGDVRKRGIRRIECKVTTAKSFSVTLDMLGKIEEAAALAGEVPGLAVRFVDAGGGTIKECWVLPGWAWEG